jgi:hypothetical protein
MADRPNGFQRSHDAERLHLPQLREAKPPAAAPGTRKASKRPAKAARASLTARLRQAAAEGLGGNEAAGELARDALKLYRSATRELGSDSPMVHTHALGWALASVLSQQLALQAAAAGLGTAQGLQLLERSAKAQGRAERSVVAALSIAGLLGGRAPKPSSAAPWLVPAKPAASPAGGDGGDHG